MAGAIRYLLQGSKTTKAPEFIVLSGYVKGISCLKFFHIGVTK